MIFPPPAHSGGGLQITNSVRLRAAASAYFSRTFGTATDGTIYTWSSWIKRGLLGTSRPIVQGYLNGNNYGNIIFTASDSIQWMEFAAAANNGQVHTNAVFRDPSAHLHLVVTRNGTTVTIYVNGVSQSLTTDVAIAAPAGYLFGNATANRIGSDQVTGNYHDGYLSDVYFIDGQALTPSSFGETNSDGVWVPKAYTGTYGTNGFHLDFKDAALTAGSNVGLGKDVSGNGNYWTTNNISVTAGVTYDSMVDTPTMNYCVMSPLDKNASATTSRANLTQDASASAWRAVRSTVFMLTGSWYWEVTLTGTGSDKGMLGISNSSASLSAVPDSNAWGWNATNGQKYTAGAGATYADTAATTDVISIAFDSATGSLYFAKNGQWASGSGSFNQLWSGAVAAYTSLSGSLTPTFWQYAGYTWDANFGQRPFTYTPPTGFKALCTANLPASGSVTTSGTFTGNAAADGPFVWLNGSPTAMTINGNAVTFGTHADKIAGGFKVRTSSASYNTAGSNTYSITTNAGVFGDADSAPQTAKGNP